MSQQEIIRLLVANQVFIKKQRQQERRITDLERQVDWFKRQLFGSTSERRLLVNNDRQLYLGELPEEDETPPSDTETIGQYQRRKLRKKSLAGDVSSSGLRYTADVPVEVIELANPALEGLDASEYEIVSEKLSEKLAQRPGSYVILRYVRKVAKLKDGSLTCAKAPTAVLEKSYADVSLLAGLIVDKFRYHLPLYRQHQRLLDSGIQLSRSTLTNFVHRSLHLLEPIYYALFSSILQSKVLTMDETPIKAGHMPGKMKRGYFWPVYGDQEEIAFVFSDSRASPVAKKVLGAFCGTLVTDGYKVYTKYAVENDVLHAQCWSHTRRKFVEAEAVEPRLVATALEFIGKLYNVEQRSRNLALSGSSKRRFRLKHSKPIVTAFFSWLAGVFSNQVLLPSSPFTVAANYALDRQEALSVFLDDPDVPIDTNHIERQIRAIALGRKNWMFCWTEVGAHYTGIANSLIASCRMQGIDPYTYLVDVLQRVDAHKAFEVHRLTPRLWKEDFADQPLRSDLYQQSQ